MIEVSIQKQLLTHHRRSGVCYHYPVSTSARGPGNQRDSLQTPIGKHVIVEKIGADMPIYTAFRARIPFKLYNPKADNPNQDWILTRILRLGGSQTGINRRGPVDSFSRYIYIHGTHAEEMIGQPASHGCIRMRNQDIIDLFTHVQRSETVIIYP